MTNGSANGPSSCKSSGTKSSVLDFTPQNVHLVVDDPSIHPLVRLRRSGVQRRMSPAAQPVPTAVLTTLPRAACKQLRIERVWPHARVTHMC
jgi:hypothetical protein